MGQLDKRTAIVTGAAGGIGRATAAALADAGAAVALSDLDGRGLDRTVKALETAGAAVLAQAGDVTDAAACRRLVEATVEGFGGVDVLVNNAAIGVFNKTVESTTEDEWDRTMAVNAKSVFLMSREAIPLMRRRGGGVIVNVSSIHAMATSTGVAPYAASKGAVLALTRNMALDYAPDRIRVVALIPGAVDTAMLRSHAERSGQTVEELGFSFAPTDVGRVGRPEEIASTVVFLASDAASFITGSPLIADGGMLAQF